MDYKIKIAEARYIDKIMRFFREQWSAGHILANDRDFFEYEFLNKGDLRFVIAVDLNDDILATLGFISYMDDDSVIMLAMWKSAYNKNPFLGVQLLDYLMKNKGQVFFGSVGINQRVQAIYKHMGFKNIELDHYYRASDQKKYSIGHFYIPKILPVNEKEYDLKQMSSMEEFNKYFDFESYEKSNIMPKKERWYIEKRYFKHPIYQYQVYGIRNEKGQIGSALFMREVSIEGVKILRIVDFLGKIDDLNHISYEIQRLLEENNYEYIDFYQYGISEQIMNQAGFVKKGENDIVPNYFEPYVKENVPILCTYIDRNSPAYLFKGDGDQDRPNYSKKKE